MTPGAEYCTPPEGQLLLYYGDLLVGGPSERGTPSAALQTCRVRPAKQKREDAAAVRREMDVAGRPSATLVALRGPAVERPPWQLEPAAARRDLEDLLREGDRLRFFSGRVGVAHETTAWS